jgi:hypothetical protein
VTGPLRKQCLRSASLVASKSRTPSASNLDSRASAPPRPPYQSSGRLNCRRVINRKFADIGNEPVAIKDDEAVLHPRRIQPPCRSRRSFLEMPAQLPEKPKIVGTETRRLFDRRASELQRSSGAETSDDLLARDP